MRKFLEDRDAAHQTALAELRSREQEKLEHAQRNYKRELEHYKQQHAEAEAQVQQLQAAARSLETKSSQWHTLLASALESVHALVTLPTELISVVRICAVLGNFTPKLDTNSVDACSVSAVLRR